MIQVQEIQSKIEALSAGMMLPWEFYEWLQDASRNMRKDSAPDAIELAASAKIIFNDYDQRVISKDDLIEQLVSLIRPVVLEVKAHSESRFAVFSLQWAPSNRSWVGSASLAPQEVQVRG